MKGLRSGASFDRMQQAALVVRGVSHYNTNWYQGNRLQFILENQAEKPLVVWKTAEKGNL